MIPLQQRLLDFLTVENPVINQRRCRGGGNTKSKNNKWCIPRYIQVWEDFEYDSLRLMYGGDLQRLLQRKYQLSGSTVTEDSPFRTISDETSFDGVFSHWIQARVSEGLSKAQGTLQSFGIRENIYMKRGGQADYPGSMSEFNPDWAGVRCSHFQLQLADTVDLTSRRQEPRNILPGESKVGKKWSSDKIVRGPLEIEYQESHDWLRPLSQVFTYCVKANARYGYIVTAKELVVLRVRPFLEPNEDTQPSQESDSFRSQGSASDAPSSFDVYESSIPTDSAEAGISNFMTAADRASNLGALEFKAIPWENCERENSQALTVNLALWWLYMLAGQNVDISDTYKALREETWYERLSDSAISESLLPADNQELSDTGLHSQTSYPSPDSIKVRRKRSRSREEVDDDEEVQTPKGKRQASSDIQVSCVSRRTRSSMRN